MAKETCINSDRWCAVAGLLFCSAVFMMLANIDASVRTFPLSITGLIFLCFAALLWKSFKPTAKKEMVWIDTQAVGVLVFAGVYILLLPYLGYLLCTGAFCLATTLMLGYRKMIPILIVVVGFSSGLYFLFLRALGVPLPRLGVGFF